MVTGMLHSHYLFVVLFTLIYLIKTILLLSDKDELLEKFKQKTKIAEMIVSFGFLATGIFLVTQMPQVPTLMYIKVVLVLASIPLAVIGFKKKNKVLATLSFFLIVVSFGLGEHIKKAKAGAKVSAEVVDGKAIYQEKCVACHGDNGKAGTMGAKDLTQTQLSHVDIVSIITNGKNAMTSYKETMSAEQIEAVANYVETNLKGK